MAKKRKVYISYHYDTDRHYKNLLLAWNKNKNLDFHMRDQSADLSVNSAEAPVIKRILTEKIGQGNYFMVLIGKVTKKCEWVKWEIAKAKELEKKIIAIKIHPENKGPAELYGAGAAWALNFRLEAINAAMNKI